MKASMEGTMNSLIEEMLSGNELSDPKCVDIIWVIDTSRQMKFILEKLCDVESVWNMLAIRWEHDLPYRVVSRMNVRFKIVSFSSLNNRENMLRESPFFVMPNDIEAFQSYLSKIEVSENTDEKNYGLAALALAMNSFFNRSVEERHIIVFFSNAEPYSFEQISEFKEKGVFAGREYEEGLGYIPDSVSELCYQWSRFCGHALGTAPSGMFPMLSVRGRRLLLVTPSIAPWNEIEFDMDDTLRIDMNVAGNLEQNIDFKEVFDLIVAASR